MEPLVRFLRANPWARRALSGVSVLLLVAAVGMLGYPFYTNVYSNRVQDRLRDEIASPELQQSYKARTVEQGDPLTRIIIPALGVDTVVVEGIGARALRAGAGHYPDTPLPCEPGNVAIAGHRTTYGKPFANVDRLKPGDDIILETPVGRCVYEVRAAPTIHAPTDFSVIANDPARSELTLTSCHPKGSAAKRIVIKADLVEGGAARA